ncbi:MAG: glycosyltransferase family 2 protein [Chitinophagaceae bacterium]|nr:glycosyltransferase family 2 protein [Chitinophagaceae bacterium]
MPANAIVAIILINWNNYPVTADCIRSLQETDGSLRDIIVVDNISADDSLRRLREEFPEVIFIASDTNRGFAGGNNLGMEYAIREGYRYVLVLNNDTFVKKDFLQPLISYMDRHPATGVIQPLIYFHHDRSLVWNGGSYFNRWFSNTYTTNYNKPLHPSSTKLKEVDWVTGCAFFTRTSILKQTGLFAENLFMYYEDVDLSFRIKKAGYGLIYEPASVIYHIAGVSNKTAEKGKEGYLNPFVHYMNLRNRIWIVKKYTRFPYALTAFLYNFFYILALMGYFVARSRFAKFRAVIKAVRDGLNGRINYQ